MTYRARSPYAVLPASDVRRPLFPHRDVIADAYDRHGLDGLRVVLRDLLRWRFERRAGSPAEVRLLREALAVEVEDAAAYWRARLDGLDPDAEEERADPVAEYLAPDNLAPEEVERVRESFASNLHRRMSTGGLFHECPACSTWFAPQRARTSFDGRVYCSARCRARARRDAEESA